MAKARDHRSGGSHRGDGPEEFEDESFDDPDEHLEIERRRFSGGLPATPELYARAREQWYRLLGSVVRPPMDPVIDDRGPGEQHPPEEAHPDEKEPGQ